LEEVYNFHSGLDNLFPLAMEAKRIGQERNSCKGKVKA
jgi:hypothetical protein